MRAILPSITAPTLVIHLEDNQSIPADHGRYLAASIPGARLVLLPEATTTSFRTAAHR